MPRIEQLTRRAGFKAVAAVLSGVSMVGAGPARVSRIARAQEGDAVAGVVAEASAEAGSEPRVASVSAAAAEVSTKALPPPYQWQETTPNGSLITRSVKVISNNFEDNIFTLNPDKKVNVTVRDPNTFAGLRGDDGNFLTRESVAGLEFQARVRIANPSLTLRRVVIVNDETVGRGETKRLWDSRFPPNPKSLPNPENGEFIMYFETVIRPDDYTDALVFRYRMSNAPVNISDDVRKDFTIAVNWNIATALFEGDTPSNTVVRPIIYEGDIKRGAPAGDLSDSIQLIEPNF